MPSIPTPQPDEPLADPAVRRFLEDFVRRRVHAADVEDVVQTVLCDALAAKNRPADESELKRYLVGIARHKIADVHRKGVREPSAELHDVPVAPPPYEARELVRWAEEQAPPTAEAQRTLAWMAREGEGEKLESIAEEEKVPAARVRQRVSRMRRWMKERWLAELAAVAALSIAIALLWRVVRAPKEEEAIVPDQPKPSALPPEPSPLERARALRADALRQCERAAWKECLDGLDEASRLDPAGDREPAVVRAREAAAKALAPKEPAPAPEPTTKAPPPKDSIDSPLSTPTSAPTAPKSPVTSPKVAPKSEGEFLKKGKPRGKLTTPSEIGDMK